MRVDPRRREQRGWYWYDWAASAFSTTVVTVFLGPYLTSIAQAAQDAGQRITLFGVVPVNAESYYPYIVSLSVALQILVMPIVGALADVVKSRRLVMGIAAYIGAIAVMGLWFLEGTAYQVGGLLFVIANVAFGSAIVAYNSFLPEIAEPHERDRVSSIAWAMGYVGGLLLLFVNLGLYLGHESIGIAEDTAVRLALLSAGGWWAIFTIIPLKRLRDRPPHHSSGSPVLVSGFRQLSHTLRDLRAYPQALLFLVAFFFYNDGIQTVIGLSATYADIELGLDTTTIIAAVIVVQVVGIAGALLLARWARAIGAKRVVLASIVLWSGVLIVAYLLPAGSTIAFMILAAFIGFVLGGSQALSRSLFAQLVPRDREGEYFSLFEVSGSASAVLGPLVFGLTLQFAGSYRLAILFLAVFFVIGGVLLARVDVRAGMAQVADTSARRTLT